MNKRTDEPIYRASTFKLERSPAAWQAALARLPNAHALQSWAWGQFKARWGWEAIPLTMAVAGNSWDTIAAAMVLKRRIPRLPYCVLYVPKGPVFDYHDHSMRRQVFGRLEQMAKRERAIFIKIDRRSPAVGGWSMSACRRWDRPSCASYPIVAGFLRSSRFSPQHGRAAAGRHRGAIAGGNEAEDPL